MKKIKKSEFNLLDKLSKFMAKLFIDKPEGRKAVMFRVALSVFSLRSGCLVKRELQREWEGEQEGIVPFF